MQSFLWMCLEVMSICGRWSRCCRKEFGRGILVMVVAATVSGRSMNTFQHWLEPLTNLRAGLCWGLSRQRGAQAWGGGAGVRGEAPLFPTLHHSLAMTLSTKLVRGHVNRNVQKWYIQPPNMNSDNVLLNSAGIQVKGRFNEWETA